MRILMVFCMVLGVAACSGMTKEKLGLAKKTPNEKLVEQRAPLSMPPEFDLRPVAEVDEPADEI